MENCDYASGERDKAEQREKEMSQAERLIIRDLKWVKSETLMSKIWFSPRKKNKTQKNSLVQWKIARREIKQRGEMTFHIYL